jgi:hypothetical protein
MIDNIPEVLLEWYNISGKKAFDNYILIIFVASVY